MLLLLLSQFSRVQLCATPWTAAHQAPRPWDSPGKNTGVGCHCLLVKGDRSKQNRCGGWTSMLVMKWRDVVVF